jgi:hypothetical protein
MELINYVFSYGALIVCYKPHRSRRCFFEDSEINSGLLLYTTPHYKRQTSPLQEHLLLSVNQIYQLWNAALSMTLWEKTKIITESYADPEMASNI